MFDQTRNPADGTSVIGLEYPPHDDTPSTCEGMKRTAGRLLLLAIKILDEPIVDNSRSASILMREALAWMRLLDRGAADEKPEVWEIPKSPQLASLSELATLASDVSNYPGDAARWVLDYLVMAIDERSIEIPQRVMDAVEPEHLRQLDRLAGEHPETVSRWISGPFEALQAKAEADAQSAAEAAEHEKMQPLTPEERGEREARIRETEASTAKLIASCRAELEARGVLDVASVESG